MTSFVIKLIAIVTMAIDHIGLFFFPNIIEFRIIGRIAFPLFAWLIANGAYYTHNLKAYMERILLLGIVSQIPFFFANQYHDPTFLGLNVLFTLFLGLVVIWVIRRTDNKLLWLGSTILLAIIANMISADYGAFGVLSIVLFYLFFNNLPYLIVSQVILFFSSSLFLQISNIETFGLFALLCIALYNKQEGPKAKYLFYAFYPLQYVVIYLVQRFL